MPAKKSGGSPKSSLKKKKPLQKSKRHRVGSRSLEQLDAYRKVLDEESARLDVFCRQLAQIEAERVSFDGINRIDDAVEMIYGFVDGVEMAARKETRARGKSVADE